MIDTKQVQARLGTVKMATQTDPAKAETKPSKTVTRGRAKKEDAAYSIVFLDADNKESSRIPTNVVGAKVYSSDKKATTVLFKDFPTNVLQQYVADGFRKKSNFFLKDAKKTNPAEVHTLMGQLVTASKNATIFIPKEGGGPGRQFDYDFWVAVIAKAASIKVKAGHPKAKEMTAKHQEQFRAKLEAMPPKDRAEQIKKWQTDIAVKNAVKIVQGERAQKNLENKPAEGAYDAFADIL